jgi:hypothetical protein
MPVKRIRTLKLALLAALAASIAPAAGQEVRPESLELFGGTYSPDCTSAQAPGLLVGAGELAIEHGGRRLAASGVMDVYASFGAAPTSPVPEGFMVEFMSDAFSFHVFEDADGLYITPARYLPQAEAVIGADAMRQRFGRCP